jgi:hypothetical protein
MKQDNKGHPTIETGQILPFMLFFILWEFNILTKKFISNSFCIKIYGMSTQSLQKCNLSIGT